MSGPVDNFDSHEQGKAMLTEPVRCPRCGYDQQGAMAQWRDTCPLAGTCTECGLSFGWAELLVPGKFEPPWCVEFAPARTSVVAACIRTMIRTLWPWGFWKRLNMAFDVRWRRLAVLWLVLLLLLVACFSFRQATVAAIVRYKVGRDAVRSAQQVTNAAVFESATLLEQLEDESHPVTRSLLPEARQEAIAMCEQTISELTQSQTNAPAELPSYYEVIVRAVLLPWSTASDATLPQQPGWISYTQAYPSPATQYAYLTNRIAGGRFMVESFSVLSAVNLVVTCWLVALIPIEFVLLPVSRRRAKVRWRHVWRTAAYSITIPALLWSATLVVTTVAVLHRAVYPAGATVATAVSAVSIIAVVAWWAAAISRYMRMPRGWLIAITFAVLSLLLLVTTVFWAGALLHPMGSR